MVYNVCRPITLYNDFLPPDTEPHSDWDYLAFGYYDGIKVGKDNLFADGQCSMDRLWAYDMCQMEKLQGTYSQQTIYGFRAEDDSDFWRNTRTEESEYPFLFVILLQDKINKSLAKIEKRTEVEKELAGNGKRKVITYLTLDNSGMVMLFLCRDYDDGAALVDSFHRDIEQDSLRKIGVELSYSFTIAAVQKQFIESENVYRLDDYMLKRAYIYGIERNPGSIKLAYDKIADALQVSLQKKNRF